MTNHHHLWPEGTFKPSVKEYAETDCRITELLTSKGFFMKKSEIKNKQKLEKVDPIIRDAARKAYAATRLHYDGFADADTDLDAAPLHVQLSVIRDVRAVILGNRAPEQLHENWRFRKLRSLFGHQVTKDNYDIYDSYDLPVEVPNTVIEPWHVLTPHDKKGYELFVSTVKNSYELLTKRIDISESPSITLAVAASKAVAIHKSSMGSVSVYFNSPEEEEAFIKAVEDVRK